MSNDGAQPISIYDDVIDSRDVIARIQHLEAVAEGGDSLLDFAERDELMMLKAVADDASDYVDDWQYGATLIRDSYFREYAMELAEEIGAINPDAGWPGNCIDWDQAARELRMDYTSVDFAGVTYWVR